MTSRLELHSVSKSFGKRTVLDRVSLRVDPGRVVAVVGQNGSGKSTLLRIAAGLLAASSGEVFRAGAVGYCPQDRGLAGRLTIREHVELFAAGGTSAIDRVMTALKELWIGPELDDTVANSLVDAGLGVAWAAGTGALFATQGAAVIEQRLRLTGFSRIELALGRSAVVATIATTVSVVTIPVVWVISQPPEPVGLVAGVVTMTAVAGSLGTLLGVVTSRDLGSTIALIGVIGIDVSLTTDDRLGSVLPLRGPIKLLRYGSGSQVHDLGAIVPAVVWTVVLVAMVAVAYHRRWRLHATAAPIDHEMGPRT